MSNTTKTIIFMGLCAAVALGFVGFWVYRDSIFSKEIVQLIISGPQTAAAGEEITYTVTYKNNSNFALEKPKLVFVLPEYSLTEDGKQRITKTLQDIQPGQGGEEAFMLRLLGKEEEIRTAKVYLSYNPKGLSARYESESSFETKINTVPITLTYELPAHTDQGKEFTYAINYASTVDYPLENISIRLDPLPGFVAKSADPVSLDFAEWKLPTLQKGQGGRIAIRGAMAGQVSSPVHFAARLGMWQDGVFVVIKEVSQDVGVTLRSGMELSQLIMLSPEGIYQLTWKLNNEFSYIKDAKVKITLPQGATLGDNVSPEDQASHLSWNSGLGELLWQIGDISPATAKSITFEVALPAGSLIISQPSAWGQDQFTGTTIYATVK